MKIAHISVVHTTFDTRIYYKECKSLFDAGHDVHLIIPHEKYEISDGIKIIPLKLFKKTIYKTYFNLPLVLIKSLKINAHAYHLHDPELIPIGAILKIFGKIVIYDVHEVYSEMPKRHFFRYLFNFYEKIAIKLLDRFVIADPLNTDKFPKNRTIVVCNYPILGLFDDLIKSSNKNKINGDKLILIYQGGLTRNRGIKDIINATGILNGKVKLVLLGKWEKDFQQECQSLSGWDNVTYLGFKKVSEVYNYTISSDIGLATLYPHPNYLCSLPVKVFEYMALSIPTVMSDFPYWKEMYSECALFVNPYDPKDIAEKIQTLLDNKELRIKLGKRGRELVETQYNWETESKKLIKLYKELYKG